MYTVIYLRNWLQAGSRYAKASIINTQKLCMLKRELDSAKIAKKYLFYINREALVALYLLYHEEKNIQPLFRPKISCLAMVLRIDSDIKKTVSEDTNCFTLEPELT